MGIPFDGQRNEPLRGVPRRRSLELLLDGRPATEAQMQARIEAATAPLLQRIAELEQKIARLEKNSSNSSKPPSSDIVKPPKKTVRPMKGKRGKGGQKGHPRHERTAFTESELDYQVTYELEGLDPKE